LPQWRGLKLFNLNLMDKVSSIGRERFGGSELPQLKLMLNFGNVIGRDSREMKPLITKCVINIIQSMKIKNFRLRRKLIKY
jgi:hypothetical protein